MCEGWTSFFDQERNQPYYIDLMSRVDQEYDNKIIYPKKEEIFRCFMLTPYDEVKVVIVGQDPYHEENQAHGLCFSVNHGIPLPPSLRNIYHELSQDINIPSCCHGNLTNWAKQGVLLLNTILTVEQGKANSHKGYGWETFTDHVLCYLNNRSKPIVFFLWGKQAQEKKKYVTAHHHLILTSSHPSPLSAYRDFFGSRPFSKANEFLVQNNMEPINWKLQEE